MAAATSTATPASRDTVLLPGFGEIEEAVSSGLVVDHCADRHRYFDRVSLGAGPVASLAVPTALGLVFRIEAELEQRVLMFRGHQRDIAATAAIATARPAAGHVFLAAERKTPVAAISGFHGDDYFVDKHLSGNAAVGRSGSESSY